MLIVETLNDDIVLYPEENINAGIVGITVDYLTRFLTGSPIDDAFSISLLGAMKIDEWDYAQELLTEITGLDDVSIYCACMLARYDTCYRSPMAFVPVQSIIPDSNTISNIRIMVNLSISL